MVWLSIKVKAWSRPASNSESSFNEGEFRLRLLVELEDPDAGESERLWLTGGGVGGNSDIQRIFFNLFVKFSGNNK